jgi:hypothetical protein
MRFGRGARRVAVGGLLAVVAALGMARHTSLAEPPRYDGAGYAVLARSIRAGAGYRELDHPDRPPHAHFPPGYPLALAGLWSLTGDSAPAAHLLSIGCTVAAVLLTWRWLATLYPGRVAALLGLALACNWRWQRDGGAIRSEPLFLLLSALALLAAARLRRRGGWRNAALVGGLLGAAVLTRHVGAMLALAVVGDAFLSGRRREAVVAAGVAGLCVLPWAVHLASARQPTQAGLLPRGGLAELVAAQAVFYAQRLPDALAGPLLEIGTVFRPRWTRPATLAGALASAVMAAGWVRCLRSPRRRLSGLVALLTLGLLLVWPFTEAGRFLVPLVPVILVGALEGLVLLGRLAGRRPSRAALAGLLVALAIPYSLYAAVADRAAAERRLNAGFDAACAWLSQPGRRPGPVLTRHPGEVAWQTGRTALAPPGGGADADAIDAALARHGVAYVLVDGPRYANAPANPLEGYVRARPGRLVPAWSGAGAALYAVAPAGGSR